MNIIFLTKYFPPDTIGGGEISAYYLARGLKRRGHKIMVIKRGKEDYKRRYKGLLIQEVKDLFNKEVPNLEQRWAKRQALLLKKYIPGDAEILHSQDFHSTLILAELKNLKKHQFFFVATVRDFWPVCGYGKVRLDGSVCPGCSRWSDFKSCPKVQRGNLIQKYVRLWRYYYNIPKRQATLSQMDHIVYISKTLKREINQSKNLHSPLPGYVIYNPIPLKAKEMQRQKGDGKTLLFAGLLDLHKGLDVLLVALAQVKCDFKLIVAGAGPLFDFYRKLVRKLGIEKEVNFLGQIPYQMMGDLYRQASIVVAPSLWPEPFGRTLIEGMYFGKAVVGTSHGAPAEFIQNNKNGILVKPGDHKELAEKIFLLLKDREFAEKLGQNGRAYVLNHFHPDKIAKQYEMVYQETYSA